LTSESERQGKEEAPVRASSIEHRASSIEHRASSIVTDRAHPGLATRALGVAQGAEGTRHELIDVLDEPPGPR
jgi:hypothetical protein